MQKSKKKDHYAKLVQALPGRVVTKLVTLAKRCKHYDWRDRLVYSTMIYRSRILTLGCTVQFLSGLTGLHRTRTLPKILRRLAADGLVEYRGGRWHLVTELTDEVLSRFSLLKDDHGDDTLRGMYNYSHIYVPSKDSPLSPLDCAVYAQDLIDPDQSPAFMAGRLSVSRWTVIRSRQRIRGLIAEAGQADPSWFLAKKKKVVATEQPAVVLAEKVAQRQVLVEKDEMAAWKKVSGPHAIMMMLCQTRPPLVSHEYVTEMAKQITDIVDFEFRWKHMYKELADALRCTAWGKDREHRYRSAVENLIKTWTGVARQDGQSYNQAVVG